MWTIAHQAPLFMGFFPTRILQWNAVSSSRGISSTQGLNLLLLHLHHRQFPYYWATWESLISCQEPVWGTLPLAKVMRKEARHYAKVRLSLRRPPFPSIYSQNQSAYFTVLCSHLYLWLYGGLSPITISLGERVNLQLQLIKIPGHDKSVSTYKLLWRFSSLPEQVRLATCDCSQPPNCERHEML